MQTGRLGRRWELVAVEDLGEATAECAWCHNERVRFVHVVRHPEGTQMRVGCVCAGRLIGDSEHPRQAEAIARGEARRFERWLKSPRWTIEPTYHVRDGRHLHWDYTIVVHRADDAWQWTLHLGHQQLSGHAATSHEAKRAAWTRLQA